MFAAQLETSISKSPARSLDYVAQQVWKALAADLVSEQVAERLSGAIDAVERLWRKKGCSARKNALQ